MFFVDVDALSLFILLFVMLAKLLFSGAGVGAGLYDTKFGFWDLAISLTSAICEDCSSALPSPFCFFMSLLHFFNFFTP